MSQNDVVKYPTYSGLNLPNVASRVLEQWERDRVFEQSVEKREGQKPFIFFEGPPSANGLPGIHHAMGRSIKDIFCRYKTLKGFQVKRKAGWDTHGLPVELGVEKELGITKEDIGTKISVEEYNAACKKAVMKYTDIWNDLTQKMGYWVDMDNPYITYESKYMESVWWLLGQLYDKGLMYKGYTIQPYSPKAGTGLSSHEINQPGCYRDVTDTTVVAQFKMIEGQTTPFGIDKDVHFLAWTTTPWTLPSNTALTVGPKIEYVLVKQNINEYTGTLNNVVLSLERAKSLLRKKYRPWIFTEVIGATQNVKEDSLIHAFDAENSPVFLIDFQDSVTLRNILEEVKKENFERCIIYHDIQALIGTTDLALQAEIIEKSNVQVEFRDVKELLEEKKLICLGAELAGLKYEQLLPYALPMEDADKAFQVITGDFVTTSDGTGIVHTAPTFGADDAKVAKDAGVPGLLVENDKGMAVPLVDLQGRFRPEMGEFAGMYVKNEYYNDGEAPERSVDVQIAIKLKEENKAFRVEKYVHSYPHCWRTDKPVLYYPLDSWFIKVTEKRDRMKELNDTINWKPESTGTGRFGEWLKNANDWNLSRSRYWGIPIPIWSTEDRDEQICISSAEQLKAECEKAVAAGLMDKNPLADFVVGDMSDENYAKVDFHKNYMDEVILVSPNGKPMRREADLIDVWFDSGSMPYAQWHYPFENKELVDNREGYPADFIAEGVDQTRGWFYTLHTIATLVFDSVAYKNVVSNGLVLDKNGLKMSKRLGNGVDPFVTLEKYGADATRWYMITNAQPWDNLKFDVDGISEVQRKFFGTLYNTYSFFALYANIDGFDATTHTTDYKTEIDRWVLSKLNSLVADVDEAFACYEPTRAGRLIQEFVSDHLSNWYVRLCRKRFWVGEMTEDKMAAYQTLHTCLNTIAIMSSPIAPFYMDQLYQDLNGTTESVHLTDYPAVNSDLINKELEAQMQIAQRTSSMVLGLRKKENLRVRQPLQKIMVPALDETFAANLLHVKDLILAEVNVKELEILGQDNDILVKSIKPNFKTIGPKYGKQMKSIAAMVSGLKGDDIATIESNGGWKGEIDGTSVELDMNDFEIVAQDIPGWTVSSDGNLTVALDVTLTDELKSEGIARELVNRVQNLRKDSGLEVTDRILLKVDTNELIKNAIVANKDYVCNEVLANDVQFESLGSDALVTDLVEAEDAKIGLVKA